MNAVISTMAKPVRPAHAVLRFSGNGYRAFPSEDDVDDEAMWLDPEDTFVTKLHPSHGRLVKYTLAMRADTNLPI